MQAKETKLQDIIEGTKQYVVPLFQRTYSWTTKEWDLLWKDLLEISEMESPRTHFIGSIVTMPTVSVPEGIPKYLLIDGQQRITTIFILLVLLRNNAKGVQNIRFADEVNNTLLVNQYKDELDYYKLLPTQIDRKPFENLIKGTPFSGDDNNISQAYIFFEKKLKQTSIELETLKKIITTYFSVVSIVLNADDNPYLVFESLNAKGRPLTQSDLIRNYFFMRVHVNDQDKIYKDCWYPMQEELKEDLTEYIRHFLIMKSGGQVKQSDVYFTLKDNVGTADAKEYLDDLNRYSKFYKKLIDPSKEPDNYIREHLLRLNRIEVTTAYPLLLSIYNLYDDSQFNFSKVDFISILMTLENFLIRRFVCNVPTNTLNKLFPTILTQLMGRYSDNLVDGFKAILQGRNYPKDSEFIIRFKEARLYGSGDRQIKTKLILESLEDSYNHKEAVDYVNLTIEHVLPQTITDWWQIELGEDYGETHEMLLHTIGNLTLTAYNPELSNTPFPTKKLRLVDSHLELNRYFANLDNWRRQDIETRASMLVEKALKLWPYFGTDNSTTLISPTELPQQLMILGQTYDVQSWREILDKFLNTIAELEPGKFATVAAEYPSYLNRERFRLREAVKLRNGIYYEQNISEKSILQFCSQAMECAGLSSENWEVAYHK